MAYHYFVICNDFIHKKFSLCFPPGPRLDLTIPNMPKPSSSSKYDHSVNPAKPLFVCLTCQGAGYKGEVLWVVSSDKSPVGITHLPFKLNARLSHSISHLSKRLSDLKHNGTQEKPPFSGTVFNTFSPGVIGFSCKC